METMEEASSSPPMSSVPPGFRFHPTDEELVGYYLRKKVASQKIDLDVIRDIDLYRIEPWDLQERCRIEYESQQEWYFFSHKDKKYPSGSRTNRATMAGFWKATGRDKAVYDKTSRLIGMRKTLVFYKGRAPNGHKTDWIMHEYRLQSDHNAPTQEEGWVVCRAFKKKITNGGQSNKSIHVVWDSTYFYDESTSPAVDLNVDHYIPRHAGPHYRQHHNMFLAAEQGNNSFFCKQEEIINNVKSESNNKTLTISGISSNTNPLMNSADSFLHDLPQLESPSLPLMKRPQLTTSSLPASNKSQNSSSNGNSYNSNHSEDGQQVLMTENNNISGEKVTDWRALDKFVASQLMSQEEETTGLELPPLLMLQSDKEEGKFGMGSSGFLSSTCDCDIGIRIFEK